MALALAGEGKSAREAMRGLLRSLDDDDDEREERKEGRRERRRMGRDRITIAALKAVSFALRLFFERPGVSQLSAVRIWERSPLQYISPSKTLYFHFNRSIWEGLISEN